ncbi:MULTISPECIES: hypothetical protein [Streptomyces]|uniref:hypothetical protein n=1 Tax=Streptomyces TaxID=1883 RepID=UPI0031F1B81B
MTYDLLRTLKLTTVFGNPGLAVGGDPVAHRPHPRKAGQGTLHLVAAYHGNTPLIITSGQQHRELVVGDPYLGNPAGPGRR